MPLSFSLNLGGCFRRNVFFLSLSEGAKETQRREKVSQIVFKEWEVTEGSSPQAPETENYWVLPSSGSLFRLLLRPFCLSLETSILPLCLVQFASSELRFQG